MSKQYVKINQDTHYIKIHGLQRSGTNYLSYLLDNNFENTKTLVNLGGWKHGPYSIPFISEEQSLVIIIKNPYAWLCSVYSYWKDKNYGPDLSKVSFPEFVKNRAVFEAGINIPFIFRAANPVQYWNNMNYHWLSVRMHNKKRVILAYESLLKDFSKSLEKIGEGFGLTKKNDEFIDCQKDLQPSGETIVEKDVDFTRKPFYENKQYLKMYSHDLLSFVNDNLEREIMKVMKYELEH